MAKKELGLDSMGIQKTMRMGDYLADAGGQFALNAISGLVGALTYFYTDKVGIAALTAANVALISKFIDAFTDLIMGKIMDSSNSPKGKCRPWFLRMAIPTFVHCAEGYERRRKIRLRSVDQPFCQRGCIHSHLNSLLLPDGHAHQEHRRAQQDGYLARDLRLCHRYDYRHRPGSDYQRARS